MIPLYRAALDLQQTCEEHGWRFCFIGGLVLQRWGEPRYTRDADVTLFTGFEDEENYIETLLSRFEKRSPNAAGVALKSRVLLLRHSNGIPLDVALGGLPFEKRTVERSSLWHAAEGCDLRTCSPEDLIVP